MLATFIPKERLYSHSGFSALAGKHSQLCHTANEVEVAERSVPNILSAPHAVCLLSAITKARDGVEYYSSSIWGSDWAEYSD